MTPCVYPLDHGEPLPEGWDAFRTGASCTHDTCIDVASYRREMTGTPVPWVAAAMAADRELVLDEWHGRAP